MKNYLPIPFGIAYFVPVAESNANNNTNTNTNMKQYEAIAKTKTGESVSIATTEANSIEEARRNLSRLLWATSCEDAEIREVN